MYAQSAHPTGPGKTRYARSTMLSLAAISALSLSVVHGEPAQRGTRKETSVPAPETEAERHPQAEELISILVELSPQKGASRSAVRLFAVQRGARVEHEYAILPHVINIRGISRADADRLRTMDGVRAVTEDFPVSIMLNDSLQQVRGTQTHIAGAGLAATGASVRVCVIDTGIDSDSVMYALRIDAAAGYDFFNNDSNPEDDHGHGSHVAGILLGSADTPTDVGCGEEFFAGVAPESTLIGVKALNFNGAGLASHLIAAINHCASPTLPGGPAHVINISAGGGQFTGTCDTNLVAAAANNAVAAGLVVVAAAGNGSFVNALSAPACGSQVISVGATYDRDYPNCQFLNQNFFSFCVAATTFGCIQTCVDNPPLADQRCCFSNRSALLDVTAPGCNIFSNDFLSQNGTGLKGFCGTSQATPHVAGLAALIRGLNPYLTPLEVRTIIRAGAIDLGAIGPDSSYGHGRIDVVNSLILAAPECESDLDCTDGLFCNGNEPCIQGKCVAGAPPICDDMISCTTDDCDVISDLCRFTPVNALCDNAQFCDGPETCDAVSGCLPGTPPCSAVEICNDFADICQPVPGAIWMSFAKSTQVPGLGTVENEDVVAYDLTSGVWSWILDGSDVGMSNFAIDALSVLPDGDLLLSFRNPSIRIPGMREGPGGGDRVDDSDIVRFHPTTLGDDSSGAFIFYFDGSDVGLTANEHNVDALAITPEGSLILSTEGLFVAGKHVWPGNDLFRFIPTFLGPFTVGHFVPHFDGLSAGLGDDPGENLDGAALLPGGALLLSTAGPFVVSTASGTSHDVLELTPGATRPGGAPNVRLVLQLGASLGATAELSALEFVP